MWNLKRNGTNELAKRRLTDLRNKLRVAWTHCGFKMDNEQGTTVRLWELCSVLCDSLDGRGVRGEWMHVYAWLSPFAVHLR